MLGRSLSSIIKSSSKSLSPTLSLWWTLWMWRSLSGFFANVLLQIPQVLFSLAAALLTLNCFWQVWLRQIKHIFTRSFEVEKKAKTGFVYIVVLIMRNWRQCIGSAMRWHLFIFSSFSMRVFIRIACFLWWNIYFLYTPFTVKFLFQEKLWPLNISFVMSNLIKCEPTMI